MSAATAAPAKERPILFSGPMVQAIRDGRKTQTRRVAKLTDTGLIKLAGSYAAHARDGIGLVWQPHGGAAEQPMPAEEIGKHCPYGKPGDRLWVREAYNVQPTPGCSFGEAMRGTKLSAFYRDGGRLDLGNGWEASGPGLHVWGTNHQYPAERYGVWRPSIHMPRWASRILLDVTGVRVERLQDITEDDAKAEGIEPEHIAGFTCHGSAAWPRFVSLWDSINAARGHGWDTNPWVWVVEFKRI